MLEWHRTFLLDKLLTLKIYGICERNNEWNIMETPPEVIHK